MHTHYLHDAGVFQIGIGTALLLSLAVDDAVTVARAAFVVAGTLHTVKHGIDLHLGGAVTAVYGLGALSLIGAIALIAHLLTHCVDPKVHPTRHAVNDVSTRGKPKRA